MLTPAKAVTVAAAPSTSAPVLVVVIVDQLGSWVLQQRLPSLAPNGGFAKLMHEGVYAPTLRYEHATSSTAPGHAALFTGLPPRGSGVFANERLDETTNKPVSIFADSTTHLVLDDEVLDASSSSPTLLQAATLADALRAQQPHARIISLSLKDRAAIAGGGKHPDAAIWFDAGKQRFVSSTAFTRTLPAWAKAQNAELEKSLDSVWKPLDEAWLAEHAGTPDAQPGEGDFSLGIHFPYDLSHAKERGKVFRGYPVADRAVLALARGALAEQPNDAQQPLLLVLSLSAFDYVGHVNGPDSWESWEALRELDLALAGFFAELEQRFGARLALALSADHGSSVLPETAGNARARPWCALGAAPDPFERPCEKGERLFRAELEKLLQESARASVGPGAWIRGVVEPFAYFTPAVAMLSPDKRETLEKAAISALEAHPGVARVFVSRSFAATCPADNDDSLPALVCRSLPEGSGDLYIVTKRGSFFDPNLVHGRGINHGTPYLYDRSVPLFLRSAAHERAGERMTQPLAPADFTATAAALLRIQPPSGAASGRNLLAP
jgi:predicted AlkP superfamily pyrophosphatase or phosphodiesterase